MKEILELIFGGMLWLAAASIVHLGFIITLVIIGPLPIYAFLLCKYRFNAMPVISWQRYILTAFCIFLGLTWIVVICTASVFLPGVFRLWPTFI